MLLPRPSDNDGRWVMRRDDFVVITGLTVLVCVPVWPGNFTIDSQAMLSSARESKISNWYAPLHQWMWSVLDGLGFGPAAVFALGVLAFIASVFLLARQFLPPRAARLVTIVTVLFPPVYGLLGWVGRDVWFATAVVGITALAWHIRRASIAASPWALVALIVLGISAADARQNGLPFYVLAVAVGVAALALVDRLSFRVTNWTRIAAVVLGAVICWSGLRIAQDAVVTVHHHPEQFLLRRI
jgi:hypothetical protein